jgi:hypothetical protein
MLRYSKVNHILILVTLEALLVLQMRLFYNILGGILNFFHHCFICRLSDSTVPTDAGIYTPGPLQLVQWQSDSLTTIGRSPPLRSEACSIVLLVSLAALLYAYRYSKVSDILI